MTSNVSKTKGFQFKQFTIFDGHAGMPVSTDGVLLGAWAQYSDSTDILDIGTGTGLLSLMVAQRYAKARITSIDIDDIAIQDASHNISHSPWSQRVSLLHGDVLTTSFSHSFSGIICNPPYFNSGEQAQNQHRATARHTDTLSHQQLLATCFNLLTNDGEASFVLPKVEGEQCIALAKQQGWHLSRVCYVQSTKTKPCHRLLFTVTKQPTTLISEHLVIHSDTGGYSKDFIALTKDFYLKM